MDQYPRYFIAKNNAQNPAALKSLFWAFKTPRNRKLNGRRKTEPKGGGACLTVSAFVIYETTELCLSFLPAYRFPRRGPSWGPGGRRLCWAPPQISPTRVRPATSCQVARLRRAGRVWGGLCRPAETRFVTLAELSP